MYKWLLVIGGTLAFLTVLLGAWGSHGLAGLLEANDKVKAYDLAVDYMGFHALGLLLIAVLAKIFKINIKLASILLIAGVVLFSGSLIYLALTNVRFMAYVTPLGGLCFLAGWLSFVISILAETKNVD